MFNNQKINYTALFLLFCVASSKGIIIYNEEILVALSFALFVIFCLSYFGDTVKDSLDERSSTIRFQLEDFHRLKEDSLQQLLSLHKRIKEAKNKFPSLNVNALHQLSYVNDSESQTIQLHNRFCEQIQQKLIYFQSSKDALQQDLQKSIALAITFFIISKNKSAFSKKNKKLSITHLGAITPTENRAIDLPKKTNTTKGALQSKSKQNKSKQSKDLRTKKNKI